ncbi:MAG: SBBP repeat-containing protein, partial [bacterium]|nr:SBBP repeat-containing protein [bacterium]
MTITRLMILLIGFILPGQIFAQNEMWVARYDGFGAPYFDHAFAMAVDDSGNVYVTGSSMDTTAYPDYATIKYNSAGDTVWARRYNGPDKYSADDAYAIAVDKSGNVYVTGASVGIGTYYDYAKVKYNSAGDTMGVRRYDSGGGAGDYGTAITVDNSGNVYVTGSSRGYTTIKYDSLGNTMWVRVNDGVKDVKRIWCGGSLITVDNSGNVYVTGGRYLTIKYDNFGDTMWVRKYQEPLLGGSEVSGLAVDNSGNVYVTGYSDISDTGSGSDYATIKYNSSGDTMWVRRYHGPDNSSWDEATALAIDNSGNVYVTGKSFSSDTNPDYATIKYNSFGDTMWVRRYNGPGNTYDWANALAVDNSGNVYVTGRSCDTGTYYPDYATIKYSSSG